MKRIIKFKVWYSDGRKATAEVGAINFVNGEVVTKTDSNVFKSSGDDVILLQFTNNFDAKGREIYHGDILKNSASDYFEVQCYHGNFVIFVGEETVYLTDLICQSYEVSGNVFENEEFVKSVNLEAYNKL